MLQGEHELEVRNMNRNDLQRVSRLRIKEARVLLKEGCFLGAYYLLGYAVECALKARIAKQIKRHDFPDRKLINDSYTHDLGKLLRLSGLEIELQEETKNNRSLEVNWAVIKDWSEESRYFTDIPKSTATDLYSAVMGRKDGFLSWVKKRW